MFFGWLIVNWELVFTIFNFDEAFSLDKKIDRINKYINEDGTVWYWFKEKLFARPIKYAFVAIVIVSLLKLVALLITTFINKSLKPIVYKVADNSKLVTKEDLDDIKGQLHRLRAAYDNIFEEKSATILENQSLQEDVAKKTSAVNEAEKLHNKVLTQLNKVSIEKILFTNQEPPEGKPTIDDHYYPNILDLSNYEYEILVVPTAHIEQWRCGIKFSKNTTFPDETERHQKDYPLFHLEKNENEDVLKVSYYDEKGGNINSPTKITFYEEDKVSIKVIKNQNEVSIDVVDENHESILIEQRKIGNYPHCKLFAWNDTKNTFEIASAIKIVPK